MLNFRLYLALFSVILFGAGCKEDEDWVQVHFTLRNESRVGLEDLGIRHKGTQRQAGYLGPNGMMAFSPAKLSPQLKSLTLVWKEGGTQRKAVVEMPPLPAKSEEPPYVTLTYSEEHWTITIGTAPPRPMPRH